jgi:hypothetical protein
MQAQALGDNKARERTSDGRFESRLLALHTDASSSSSQAMEYMKGKKTFDPFIYLGTGGSVYMYYRLFLYA